MALEVLNKLGIPHGVVINRSDVGDKKIDDYCEKNNIPIFLRIPLDEKIARAYSQGEPLIKLNGIWKDKFRNLFSNVKERIGV